MTGALLFLMRQSVKNRLVMRVRRLKQPKYLVGALFGGLYFLYVCFSRYLLTYSRHAHQGALTVANPETMAFKAAIGAFILLVMVVLGWVIPHERARRWSSVKRKWHFCFPRR
ncbi:MAG: hypothetical protein JWR19_1421 [Pedosphaera sp.]|nr:hypothetical protein [Pedosphaera sp.]